MDLGTKVAQLEKRLAEVEHASRMSSASLDDTALEVRDSEGSLRAIVGQQADGTTAMNVVNGPPPPTPTAPVVVSVLGGVSVTWDGAFADGQAVPLDWQRVEVHASTESGFTPAPATVQATIETPQGATVVVPTDADVYVALVSRNTSGTASPPTDEVGPTGPAPVVATDILDGIVTTVKLADDAVTAAKVAAAAVTPEALTPVLADTVSQRWVDLMEDPTAWTIVSQGTGATWDHVPVADAPSGGGNVGQASGYIGVRGTTLIPHDPNTLYRISVRIRTTVQPAAGTDNVYLGLMGFAGDKTTMVNRAGSDSTGGQFYVVASLQPVAGVDGWTVYTGFIQGRGAPGVTVSGGPAPDPLAPGPLHDQVRYMTPYLLLNYTHRDNAGIMQVDTVSVEALRTGVVTAAYLAAGSVSTSKLVAGAVQTAQLDTAAVNADKIAAGAVTTAKLDALAVTADKIAANAITAEKILAGSVTTTALAADAITGKTITGGTINGAEFHSDDGAGGLVDIADGTITATAPSNWKIIIDPTRPDAPVIYFKDSTDYVVGSMNVAGTTDRAALYVASGELSDGVITDWRWVNFLGETATGNQYMASYRTRQSDQDAAVGGWVYLGPAVAQYGLADTETPSVQTVMQVTEGVFIMDAGRLIVDARPTASSALWVNVDTAGHTGNLLLLQREGVGRFHVDKDGDATSAGDVTALGNLIADDGLIVDGVDQGHGYVAFQARSTATTASATEQIALTQTSVSLKSGRAYRIKVRGLAQNDTANTGVRVRVRKTNTAGAIWLDSFTVTTPVAGANYQFINEQVIRNDSGVTITTDLVMTYVRVAAGNAFLNTGNGLSIAFDVTDIGSSANFATAQAVT